MNAKERLLEYLKYKNIGQTRFEELVGISNGYINNSKGSIGAKILSRISEKCDDLNINWIVSGDGDMLNDAYEIENNNGNQFIKLPNGQFLMIMPTVGVEAQAGFLDNYGDVEFLAEMPKHSIIVNEVHKGHYISFIVDGDSMDNGKWDAIKKDYVVATRELQRSNWNDKLRFNKFQFWIIYTTKSKKPLLKQIINHDTETATIICHSLNESPEYSDFELSLNDVNKLFYVVDISRKISDSYY